MRKSIGRVSQASRPKHFDFEETAVIAGSELVAEVDALLAGTYSLVVRAGKRGERRAAYIDVPMLLVA